MPVSDQRQDIAGLNSPNDTKEHQECSDHFVQRGGMTYAGTHLLLDFWGAQQLDCVDFIEQTLKRAVLAAGAELLHIHLHRFTTGGGVSGVALLAESHISVHTWPECGYAAFDIFMCGTARPELAAQLLEDAFQPVTATTYRHRRGLLKDD